MSNKTNIEEDIEIAKNLMKYLQIKIDSGEHKIFYNNLMWEEKTIDCINAIENILADRERLEKENEELMEVKISASANTIISDLQKELNEENNRCAKFAVENNELQAKANKYDSLVEKIKEIVSSLKISDIEPWSTYNISGDILFDLQELLDTKKGN